MTALHRDLSAPEIWQRLFERSRRRRANAPKLRRQVARRKRASTAMAAAMLAGPAAQFAGAQTASGGSGPDQTGIAAESPANRAIAGQTQSPVQSQALLQVGSAGDAVAAVQRELGITANGMFGEETDRAVRAFQAEAGLVVDGIVGVKTWGALFGSGGGTGPAADIGGPNLQIEPAVADDRTPVGDRTRFAVRMASTAELSADELDKLGVTGSSASEGEGDGGLVAIKFHTHEDGKEPEPTRDDGHSHASVAARDDGSAPSGDDRSEDAGDSGVRSESTLSTDAPRSDRSAGNDDGDSGEEETEAGSGSAVTPKPEDEKPEAGKPEPREESKPRDDGADAGSGSCSRRLVDPLGGRGTFTSGYRTGSRPSHAGIDLSAPSGTSIRAAACGVISHISSNNGYGNYICVRHSSSFTTCYAHLSRFSDERMGDSVRQGQVIGHVGSTGNSTGPHLHFETRTGPPYGRNDVDPRPYLNGREYSGTQAGASSRGMGGPDLEQPKSQPRQASTAHAASSTEERSAVAIATDRDEPASTASSEQRASDAAEPQPVEPVAEQPAPRAGEPDAAAQQAAEKPPARGEADGGDEAQLEAKPAKEAPKPEPAAEENGEEAPAEDASAESAPQTQGAGEEGAQADESAPATGESVGAGGESTPQDEGQVASEHSSESSPPKPADTAPSNGPDPSTGEGGEQPSAGDAATGGDTSAEGAPASAASNGDAGPTGADGSSSLESGPAATATAEAPASTATTGSGSANGSGQAETGTASTPSETSASSTNGSSDATASGGSEASTATGEGDSSASGSASSDASTEAYFSEEESDDGGIGAGD